MEKFSVKRPFTILVAVIAVIVLGFVSVMSIPMDLLPQISLPYMLVITTYPGASPEKVELEISEPMENALGTIANVKNVNTVSAENYSLTQLEFEDGTDIDSAMVKVSSAVNQLSQTLPDTAGVPNILEISMDMVATMYIAIEREGYDVYELSDYVSNEVIPHFERAEGVASVTDVGLVKKTVQVELNQTKINALNDKILTETTKALEEAKSQLDDAQGQVDAGQALLEEQESSFGSTLASGIFDSIRGGASEIAGSMGGFLEVVRARLAAIQASVGTYGQDQDSISEAVTEAQTAYNTAQAKVTALSAALAEAQAAYAAAQQAVTEAGEEVTPELQEAAALALSALTKAATDLVAAQEELTQAATILQNAMLKGSALVDVDLLSGQIAEAIASVDEALESLDGSSISSLMASVTKISGVLARVRVIASQVAMIDVNGIMTEALQGLNGGLDGLSGLIAQVPALLTSMESVFGMLTQGQLDAAVGFSTAAQQLSMAQTQLSAARQQYESSRAAALENANADALLTPQTLSQIIYAQNFSMPAGYIDDKNDQSWLLKIGDEYEDSTEIADSLLVEMDVIGSVRLSDVADITVIDNSDMSYSKLNGEQAVVLSIYKGSTSGTNEVSRNINKAIRELEEKDPGTEVLILMDQGQYISIIVNDLLRSMLLGALLAIIILAIFLRDIRPTFLVGLSIPLSVMFALVLMYFTDLSLNIMTLSGLSLGIGMLVDNSIVVIENIFRLRGRDMAAPRAAVQGAKQVAGAITASTLTTICVFFPMVFTTGTVRELLVPMALSISFCLFASLVVAMTVVPAASSTVFRRFKPKNSKIMGRVQNVYGKTLRWCLRHKLVTVAGAIALLAVCIVRLITMGIVIIPDISGEDIQVTIVTPEGDERAESYKKVDNVLQAIMDVDGVSSVGIMDASSTTGLISSMQSNSSVYGSYICYVTPESGAWTGEMKELCKRIEDATDDLDCEITVSTGGMSDMTSLLASGLTINISGNDLETLNKVSEDVMDIVAQVNGFSNILNGSENAAKTLHLVIDRDKAMSYGLTVAQIYAQIAQRLTTSVTSTTITTGGEKLEVVILDKTNKLTRENILDMEFEAADMAAAAGASAGASGMDAQAFAAMTGAEESGSASASSESKVHKLKEFATLEETSAQGTITRKNLTRYISVTAETDEGYNLALLTRKLEDKLAAYEPPQGYKVEIEGESSEINDMLTQMSKLMALALLFIYLVMVAQFQSLLSPFIVMFTIPLAFTGGMIGLIIANEQLSMLSLMGFLILMGTVVNNGIVFVDYTNQLRIGGMERRDALVATGRTRMRPILMTAMTTILAMMQLIIGKGMGSQMGRGMAIVIASGLIYATLMTLYIIPVMYDIFFRRAPLSVDTGDDLEDAPDDAAEFIAEMEAERRRASKKEEAPSEAPGKTVGSEEEEEPLKAAGKTVGSEEDKESLGSIGTAMGSEMDKGSSGSPGTTVGSEEDEDSPGSSGIIVEPGEYEDLYED